MPYHHLRDMPAIRWKTENLRKFAHAINSALPISKHSCVKHLRRLIEVMIAASRFDWRSSQFFPRIRLRERLLEHEVSM